MLSKTRDGVGNEILRESAAGYTCKTCGALADEPGHLCNPCGDETKCDFCGTCVGVCPENCIELRETVLSIDYDSCTICEKCIWICPVAALFREEST